MFQKHEVQHNSDEQVREILAKAMQSVAELDPEPALREAVFNKAAEMYSSKTVTLERISAGGIVAVDGR